MEEVTEVVPASRGLRHWFRSDRRFWHLLCFVLGTISLLKGIRFPGPWAATQAQLDYRDGFVKRGLFGTLFTAPLGLNHYARFAAFSFAVLAVAVVLLVVFARRSGMLRVGPGEAAALFASGAALLYLGNLNGYDDVLLLAVTLALLLIRVPLLRFLVALPVCIAAMLVHEGFLLLLLPAMLFSFAADAVERRIVPARAMLFAGVLALCCLVTGVLVAAKTPVTADRAFQERQGIIARVDFPVRDAFFAVLTRSAAANVKLTLREQLHNDYQWSNVSGVLALLPVVTMQLVYLRLVCMSSGQAWLLTSGMYVALAASLAPLLMYALGYDTQRWYAFSSISAFLVLGLLVRALPQAEFTVTPSLRNATILTIAISMAVSESMLTVHGNEYPFVRSVRSLLTNRNFHALQPAEW